MADEFAVRRKVVDARYLEASVPATHVPGFEVAADARVVPVNDLPATAGSSFTVLGSGKTAVDACVWLLDAEKNRLCPPNPYPSSVDDWPRMVTTTWQAEQRWLSEPDLARWIASTRLNLLRALPDHLAEPAVQTAVQRYVTYVGPAIERMTALTGTAGR